MTAPAAVVEEFEAKIRDLERRLTGAVAQREGTESRGEALQAKVETLESALRRARHVEAPAASSQQLETVTRQRDDAEQIIERLRQTLESKKEIIAGLSSARPVPPPPTPPRQSGGQSGAEGESDEGTSVEDLKRKGAADRARLAELQKALEEAQQAHAHALEEAQLAQAEALEETARLHAQAAERPSEDAERQVVELTQKLAEATAAAAAAGGHLLHGLLGVGARRREREHDER